MLFALAQLMGCDGVSLIVSIANGVIYFARRVTFLPCANIF